MDKNLHNDNLEDFLRKSFEQYDDSPSDGLWDKIETDLNNQPKVVPIGASPRWWMIAATVALVALIIGQYIYFQKEKAALAEIINKQDDKIEFLEKQLKEQNTVINEISNSENNDQENTLDKKNQQENIDNNTSKKITGVDHQNTHREEKTISSKKTQNKNSGFSNSEINALDTPSEIKNADTQDLTEIKNNIELSLNKQRSAIPHILDLIDLKNVKQPVPDLSLPALAPIDPVTNRGQFAIGIHHSYLTTREKMVRVIRRPIGGPSQVFNSTRAMTGTTTLTGISAIYQTKNNWLFESGINYRSTSLSTNHLATLRFMDRRPGGSDSQYDFEYALNTSAGLVDIEVRADQTNPDETIDEFENIIVEIEAKQKIDYASVPFIVGYQVGFGKISANIKSGLLFNFLTDQSFEISGNIINNNLRSNRTNFSRRNGLGLKNTTTDFMAAIGINFGLNKYWSGQLSPTIIAPIGNRHNDPYIKSSGISAGLDFGLYFNF